jgi:hypothetical protein
MKTFNDIIGMFALPSAIFAFFYTVSSLLATEVNWYKAGFFFIIMLANMSTFLMYLATRD